MDQPQDLKAFGELFSGPGGLGYGLREAGLEPRWAIDTDQSACDTYNANVGGHAACRKVEDVDFSELDAVAGLAFGFPCNDFSQVGEQLGTEGYYGKLYKHAARAINEVRPDWFIAENVPGILQNGANHIMQAFANAGPGYRLAIHLYEFEKYGVPQRRHRVVGVGIRADLGLTYRPPAPTHEIPITAQEALAGAEEVPHNNVRTRHPKQVVERLKHIPEGENAWYEGIPEELRLNVPNCRLSVIYRRLDRNEPAYTVTGSGGGGTHMYHWEEPRALTNRERARLQTFPDSFIFEGSKEAIRRQIGMAVPPVAAEAIGRALLRTLNRSEYDFVEPSVGVLEPTEEEQLDLLEVA